MEFRRRLLPAVAGPVDAVDDQLDRGGVEQVDVAAPEALEEPRVPGGRKVGLQRAEMAPHGPVEPLDHRRVTPAVRVGERVAPRDLGVPQFLPLRRHRRGDVADPVEGFRLVQLLVQQRDNMAPGRERPREIPHPFLAVVENRRGNQFDDLVENRAHCLRCLRWLGFLFFHNTL